MDINVQHELLRDLHGGLLQLEGQFAPEKGEQPSLAYLTVSQYRIKTKIEQLELKKSIIESTL